MTASKGKTIGRLVALAIPMGLFLSLSACMVDDGPTGLVIVQDQWLTEGTNTCSIPATATPEKRIEGVLDISVPSVGYLFYPVVENQLAPLSGLTKGGDSPAEEKNTIVLNSLSVDLKLDGADPSFQWQEGCSGKFDSPVSTTRLQPGSSTSAIATIIRPCNAAALLSAMSTNDIVVTAKIRAKGHLGSGTIESPPFNFKITVCYGCLQSGYSDPAAAPFYFPNIARCSDLTSNPYLGDPCNPAQDRMVLCCARGVDSDGNPTGLQCPGVPTGVPPK